MKRIISDDIQLVKVSSGVPLSATTINVALQRAHSNKMYAKFFTKDYFIQVNFMRDNTISVSSNIRTPAFLNDLRKRSSQGWTISSVKSFVYQWMQISRRLLY